MLAIEAYGNITEAAESLFITPSALSQQLIKLESELGIQLFTRNRRKMIPTSAGTIYLETARQIITLQKAAYSEIQNLSGCISGMYRIGLTYEHGSDVFARTYPQFHKRYPGIQIKCYQFIVPELLEMLADNRLDLAFILTGTPEKYDRIEYRQFSGENLLLGLPKTHRLVKNLETKSHPHGLFDLKKLKGDQFALALGNSTMRTELIDPVFVKAGFKPNIMIETSFNNFLEELTVTGICNSIVPQSRVHNYHDAHWFYLPGYPRFQFGVAYMKGYRLNPALEAFIELAEKDAKKHMNFAKPLTMEEI